MKLGHHGTPAGYPRRPGFAAFVCALAFFPLLGSIPAALAEEDCDEYYFGMNGEPNYPKALECYRAQGIQFFVILMHLNGEGTPADVGKAHELFKAWEKAKPDETHTFTVEALRKAIQERLRIPAGRYERVDFCTDLADDTASLGLCASVRKQNAKKQFASFHAKVRSSLSTADAAILDKVMEAFAAFQAAEEERVYQLHIDGSIRGIAAARQATLVGERFQKLMGETVEQRQLKPADENSLKAADDELNRVYREGLRSYQETYEKLIENAALKSSRQDHRGYIEAYKQRSKNAQLKWIKYRDLCADLAHSLYKDKAADFDPALSMKTALTKIRVDELRGED